jgi:hypothetical protein
MGQRKHGGECVGSAIPKFLFFFFVLRFGTNQGMDYYKCFYFKMFALSGSVSHPDSLNLDPDPGFL